MDEDNIVDIAKIRKMKNLRPYRNKTDEEIAEIIRNRQVKASVPKTSRKNSVSDYDKMFKQKLESLQNEFGLDMNNSNDVEQLKSLVRLLIQNEKLSQTVDEIQRQDNLDEGDFRSLKNLGDTQAGVLRAINDIQDKLGISRKIRKEKQVDDIPQFISGLMRKAKEEFDAKTTVIMCPKCQIELLRFWLNFPHLQNKMQVELTCYKCEESILYAR